jgi:drug/metabolite transporter (DMT)-like permease
MPVSNRKGPLFILAASVCWSLGGVCIRFIPWGAMSINSLRAMLAVLVFVIYRRSVKIEFTSGNIFAALCLSATTTLFVFANKLTYAANAILLQFTAPVFIILIELIFYKKKPKISEMTAISSTIFGMLLFFAGSFDPAAGSQADNILLGNILAILSGLCFAGVFVCNKRKDAKPEQSLLLGFIISSVIGLPFIFFEVTAELIPWVAMLFLGIIQVGLAYVLFSAGIKKTPALLACLITAMEPVLNPLWVALAFGELPGIFAVFGGAVIVLTVVIYNIWVERAKKAV